MFGGAWLAARRWGRAAVYWTAFASLLFYGWDYPQFLWVLLVSTLVNYGVGGRIIHSAHKAVKKRWMWGGIAFNLLFLGYFKYAGFFIENLNAALGAHWVVPAVVLPIGISFYTFTQIVYLVDEMRHSHRQYNFPAYLLFVTFFPHLVAGPILRHDSVIPQFTRNTFARPAASRIYFALLFFNIGLFKKVIIADNIAPAVHTLFAAAPALTCAEAWMAGLLYLLQLYYDFSGYSEMAVGLAFGLNVRIPINFNSPYKSTSIIEFWRRWHRSLSWFLLHYLYIPLGGNRHGQPRRMLNLLLTMLLGGMWHGAGWTFIAWGGLHGLYLAVNHLWRQGGVKLPAVIAWPLTLLAVLIAWVPFRAPDFAAATAIWRGMAGANGFAWSLPHLPDGIYYASVALVLLVWQLIAPNAQQFTITRRPAVWKALLAVLCFVVSLTQVGKISEFLYFQF